MQCIFYFLFPLKDNFENLGTRMCKKMAFYLFFLHFPELERSYMNECTTWVTKKFYSTVSFIWVRIAGRIPQRSSKQNFANLNESETKPFFFIFEATKVSSKRISRWLELGPKRETRSRARQTRLVRPRVTLTTRSNPFATKFANLNEMQNGK